MTWPLQQQQAMLDYFGPIGENQVKLDLPYSMRLAWDIDKQVDRIMCHEKVATSLQRALKGILTHYGAERVRTQRLDLFGGCLNVRKVRGGNTWSIHSWGCAIDIDPEHNQLRWGRDRASMPEKVIEIFEDEDWVSLGRTKNYDFMHFQAARL